MKKIIVACEILILFLFMTKLLAIAEIVKRSDIFDYSLWSAKAALADVSSQTAARAPVRDVFEDTLMNERSLIISLEDRRRQLENRENFVKFEEKRIHLLKNEIVAKIEMLRNREEKITVPQESDKMENIKKIKELAKVYEATPPDKVSALFSKMDNKTAAGIIIQMNTKKAGAVWGHLDPEKAVEIAKTISGM
jgi:flagellar motility protein MotE (MotC chaperone)